MISFASYYRNEETTYFVNIHGGVIQRIYDLAYEFTRRSKHSASSSLIPRMATSKTIARDKDELFCICGSNSIDGSLDKRLNFATEKQKKLNLVISE